MRRMNEGTLLRAKEYGENLKRWRKGRGIPIVELSKNTKIKQESIARAEMGFFELSPVQKARITKFMNRRKSYEELETRCA